MQFYINLVSDAVIKTSFYTSIVQIKNFVKVTKPFIRSNRTRLWCVNIVLLWCANIVLSLCVIIVPLWCVNIVLSWCVTIVLLWCVTIVLW